MADSGKAEVTDVYDKDEEISVIHLDLDENSLRTIETLVFDKYIKWLSKASQSVFEDADDIAQGLGDALINEMLLDAIKAGIADSRLAETD